MRYGFVIDHNRCIGCHACTVACKQEHDIPVGVNRTWVKYIEKGEYPDTRRHFGVLRCNHCDDAPCIEICPTVALFRRPDGIVDFDSERCIGCKSCMQACPYDALYIDPNTHTAAKCNFCAHRVEVGLEPACVIVCPTQAIIAGDLDDPASGISRIVAREKVSVRKPEKGTKPKLFYVGIDGDLLRPTMMEPQITHLWADKTPGEDLYSLKEENRARANGGGDSTPGIAREVYDVSHPPPWGKKIAAYLWTKSVAAGVLVVAALLSALQNQEAHRLLHVASPLLALVFTGLTVFLLIFDLKRPDRFHYLLIKPNWRSWLVIGGYILIVYSLFAFLWLAYGFFGESPPPWVIWPGVLLALGAAGYTAFLFAQAKGRDLWQSWLFFWHLLVQTFIAGSGALILIGIVLGSTLDVLRLLEKILSLSLTLALVIMLGEIFLPHVSEDARRATDLLKRGALSRSFWGLVFGAGAVLPLLLLWASGDALFPRVLASALALAGVWVFEDLWIKAGQAVPLS
jgi:Fe-S-cluster-containing dehydrogenase component/formate-dependent nitrite reductase membrane component NrfD